MDLTTAQVLITGGSEGIGLGLAQRFLKAGARVIVTGRNSQKLEKAAENNTGLEIFVNDIGKTEQREVLAAHIKQTMPGINMLINNAGIQRRIALAADHAPWPVRQSEIDILFAAPVHLNSLLVPMLLHNGASTVVNVTSGGGYIPQAFAPVYSACKAALHSYTVNLRYSLKETACRVVELVPPAVQTALAGAGANHGAPLNDFCDVVFTRLTQTGDITIGFGPTENLQVQLSGKTESEWFAASATRFPVELYKA
jgi:uncharacterized oxidoreductase